MQRSTLCLLSAFILSTVISSQTANAQNYGSELDDSWRKILAISKDEGKFDWFGYPVDNFGVITMYGPPAGKQLIDSDRLCATWSCIGVTYDKVPTDQNAFINVNGYANSGGGGAINLTNTQTGKAAVTLLLSNLMSILNINGNVTLSHQSDVTLTADAVFKRSVDKQKLQDYIASLGKDSLEYTFWHSGKLTYIGADVVVQNMKIALTLDTKKDATLSAALTKAVGSFGNGSNAQVTLSSDGNGKYTLTYPKYLILATQIQRQYAAGILYDSEKGVDQHYQEFVKVTSVIPQPDVDPKTLKLKMASPVQGQ